MKHTQPQPPLAHATGREKHLIYFLALAAVCYFDLIALGPYAVVNFFDTIDNDFPHFINQGRLLLEHGLFSWYPNWSGGMPAFVGQHPPYALPSLLGAFLPLWLFSLVWYFLVIAGLGYGTFRMLHDFFNIDEKSALLVGVLSAFIPLCGNPQFVMSYLFPLFFVWTHELCEDGIDWRGRAWRVAGLIAIISSSYPVLTLPHFPIFHFFLYLAFGLKRPHPIKNMAAVFMVWTGYVLFFAPSIYSLFEYIPYAQRDYNFPVTDTLTLLIAFADQVVGRLGDNTLTPAVLLGLPLLRSSATLRKCTWFIVVPLIVGVFFGTDTKALLKGTFLIKMDMFLSTTVMTFSLALFAAKVMDILRKTPTKLNRFWILFVFVILIPLGNEQTMLRNFLLLGAMLSGIFLFRQDGVSLKRPALILAIFCGCLAGFSMQIRQSTMHESEHIIYGKGFDNHPRIAALAQESRTRPFRVASADLHPSIAQTYGLETIDQRGVLFNKHYKRYFKGVIMPQFAAKPETEQWFDKLWRYMLFTRSTERVVTPAVLALDAPPRSVDDWNTPLLLNMNTEYILSARPISGMESIADLEFIDPGDGLPHFLDTSPAEKFYKLPVYAYHLKNSFGLGRLAHTAIVRQSRDEAMQTMAKMDAHTLRDTVVFTAEDILPDTPLPNTSATPSPVSVDRYTPDTIVFSGETQSPCFLVIANNYDPRWSATINGQPAKIIQANTAFQAVYIPDAGKFTAVVTFSSPIVWWMHGATLLGLGLVGALLFMGTAGAAPSRELRPGTPGIPHRLLALTGGGVAAILWLAGYYFFIFLKARNVVVPMEYVMVVTPIMGLLVSLMAEKITRN